MSEQAQKIEHEAIPQWADGLYYNKGIFSEALIYHDGEALYFELRGKDHGVVRLSYEMIDTLKEVIEDEQTGASSPQSGGVSNATQSGVGEAVGEVTEEAQGAVGQVAGRGGESAQGASGKDREEEGEANATPSAERLAQELGVDLSSVEGTAVGGRITVRDVRSAAQN
jgi:pyruvate/2-oxoglutarate dehydrogenase complex dihydrolipoamide acyltransferase (E2) component